jgi:hypothetical protein
MFDIGDIVPQWIGSALYVSVFIIICIIAWQYFGGE